ncbi:unnamed protein product [Amoebophrya sp. A120]|nr:unnamed protein product [Amoebophrya sp. A120]|eukprot:GSA120T00011323001.1
MMATSSSSSASSSTASMNTIWLEKHRPQTLDDIVGNQDFIHQLDVIRRDPSRMTNFMLCGPPGVGKTTCIHALAKQTLGEEMYKTAVLEMNASDERGIDVVRDTIHSFARTKYNNLPPGCSKIVILDEVDSMTTSAQQALRVIMEEYGMHTKFALACNISSKVIEALQSRCAILRFGKVKESEVEARLRKIIALEKVECTDDGVKALSFIANGDLRIGINGLQSAHAGFGLVNRENVYRVCDVPNPVVVNQSLQCVIKQRPDIAFSKLNTLVEKGYAIEHVLQVLGRCIKSYDCPEFQKLEFLRLLADANCNAVLGCRSAIQLDCLVTRMSMVTDQGLAGG